jgi:hypothetical protein
MTASHPDSPTGPNALHVCKLPIPVQAAFAAGDGVCQTLEGPVRYRAGDAIVTGSQGEHWPVRRDAFLATHDAVPPTHSGESGRYLKRPALARALRLDHPCEVPVGWQDDRLHGRPGDWLLHYADGSFGVVQDAIFRATYGPAPGETRWPPPE